MAWAELARMTVMRERHMRMSRCTKGLIPEAGDKDFRPASTPNLCYLIYTLHSILTWVAIYLALQGCYTIMSGAEMLQ
jgi:hypothetical protein